MRSFRPSLVAGAIALALCTGTASAQFSGTYIFGDSLSDAGQYGARFTTNPGLDGVDVRRAELGLRVDAVVHRRQRLCAGRRAREFAVVADPAGCAEHLDRAAGVAVPRQGSARSQRALPDPGRQQRRARARAAIPGRADHAGPSAGGGRRRPPSISPRRSAGCRPAGAQYIVLQNLWDLGKMPIAIGLNQQANASADRRFVQFDAQFGDRRIRPAGHSIQRVQVRGRNRRQRGGLWASST